MIADLAESVVATLDGALLTERQTEFAREVGATSALSGTGDGCVFIYSKGAEGTLRWWISPAGHPLALTWL